MLSNDIGFECVSCCGFLIKFESLLFLEKGSEVKTDDDSVKSLRKIRKNGGDKQASHIEEGELVCFCMYKMGTCEKVRLHDMLICCFQRVWEFLKRNILKE